MPDAAPGAPWQPGDPRARAAGAKGAAKAAQNRRDGKAPQAGTGPKDKQPKRPSFTAQAKSVSSKTRARITALIGTGIVLADEAMAKAIATWGEDKLDGHEVKLLTDAIVGTALRYPKIARRLEQTAAASEFAAIPTALLLIALPRLVKHGLVPRTLSTTVSPLLNDAQSVHEAGDRAEERMRYADVVAATEGEAIAQDRAEERGEDDDPAPITGTPDPLPAAAPQPLMRAPEPVIAAPGQTFRPPPGL